ncbi:MAG: hypothetical protein IJC50_06175 [Clostridia bacterium]|nr:hypothetical protein [Clostridia bacterium]MBQ3100561.1 hypothetical protein [Clostridia bacterium]
MIDFTIKIADNNIAVQVQHLSTKEYCKEYITEAEADFLVTVSSEDIAFERRKSEREDMLEGIPIRHFSDAYLETLAVYRKICTELLKRDTLLFHGSAIAVDGEGYLFTAKSGTGKSTHTSLWRQEFGERAEMINDDKPLLKIAGDTVWVCGTPWNGKHRLGCNKIVPLKAICILERDTDNHIHRISAQEALPMLLQQSFRTGGPVGMMRLLDLLETIMSRTKIYRLGCNMNPEAARVAFEGMQK